jgi:alkaline phosphatase D
MNIFTLRRYFTLLIFVFVAGFVQAQENKSLLEAGPMLGYVEMQEANLWIQTTKPASFELIYWKKGEKGASKKVFDSSTMALESNTAHIKLTDLDYGTTYQYELSIDEKKVDLPYDTEFTTQQLWQWRKPAPNFSVAMGSCLYINDSEFDRPGTPYGKDTEILTHINNQHPDMMLWLGDNVYYREPDFYSKKRLDYRFKDARNTPAMQPLLANVINIATWDDHDYGPNNSDRSYRLREEALDIFKRYWANPGYGTKDTKGVFTKYKYNDVEFFLMDDRYHRAPNQLKKEDKAFFGEAQLQWLMDSLAGSNATFKVIVVGNQATNKMNTHESFTAYPGEQEKLMNFLAEHDIPGVLFLSGDRHFTELLKTDRKDSYPIYEFTSSPLSSGTYGNLKESKEYENPQRVEGTLVFDDQNFGMMHVKGDEDNRRLVLETYGSDGEKLWDFSIHEKDLTNK